MLKDLKKRFNEDGFIVVRDVFKPSEIEFYREVVQEAIKERKQLDLRQLEDKSKYEQSFTQCQNLWEDYPEIRKLTFDQRICKIAAELLDVKAIRIWHDQALVKEAGGRETDPHHDQPYWPIKETNTITAWIPLCDVDSTNGQLGFYPGSHKNRNKQFINIFSGNVDEEEFLESSNLSSSEVCYQELKAGDVLYVLNFRATNTVFRVTIASNGSSTSTDGDVGIYTRDSDDGEYIDAISFRGGSGVEFLSSAYSGLYLVGPTKVYIGLPFSTISQSYSQYASGDTNAFECSFHYAIQRKRVVNPQVVND